MYGYREGPVIEFDQWHPGAAEEEKQRETFKPLCITAATPDDVDGELTVPLVNTFAHPVTAAAVWSPGETDAAKWTSSPGEAAIELAPGEVGTLVFQIKASRTNPTDPPRLKVVYSTGAGAVFRHSEPVRAVPAAACPKIAAAPNLDGRLDDAAWEAAGGLQPARFFHVGREEDVPGTAKMAFARDDENVYLALDYSGDVSKADTSRADRDARAVFQTDHVQLAIDTAGKEREYRTFAVTLAGDQADVLASFCPFAGHFQRDEKWNADWTAKTVLRAGGFSVEMAIPLTALATPKPGDVWRINVVTRLTTPQEKAVEGSWSSAARAFHLPRAEGTLFGTLWME